LLYVSKLSVIVVLTVIGCSLYVGVAYLIGDVVVLVSASLMRWSCMSRLLSHVLNSRKCMSGSMVILLFLEWYPRCKLANGGSSAWDRYRDCTSMMSITSSVKLMLPLRDNRRRRSLLFSCAGRHLGQLRRNDHDYRRRRRCCQRSHDVGSCRR